MKATKKLFSECGVQCYIMNTGFFLENKIPKEVTLDLLERLVEGALDFKPFYKYENLSYVEVPGLNHHSKCVNTITNYTKLSSSAMTM